MNSGPVKVFRDPVHGYIEVPKVIVKNIIDTWQFQRLRFIEQTSMRALFPAARHDRFIHSLGTYWLGVKAFKGFRNNSKYVIEELKNGALNSDEFAFWDELWWEKHELLFQIACLMHDCAHAPFSHTLEGYYDITRVNIKGIEYTKLSRLLCSLCVDEYGEKSFEKDFDNPSTVLDEAVSGVGKPHEQMSAYIILKEYKDKIANIISELISPEITLQNQDYVFICRSIIGCHYSEESPEFALKNCIISLLNSKLIDVDGLDYIVRDAQMSGMSAYDIDYQRLLNSFTIMPVNVYEDEEIKNGSIDGLWLSGSKFYASSMKKCKVSTTVSLKTESPRYKDLLKDFTQNIDPNSFSFVPKSADEFARIDSVPKFEFEIGRESGRLTDTEFTGKILKGKRVVENEKDMPKNQPLSFVLAYDKRCLSLIQNTISARNDEYLWVYSHPKVMYNAVYLQCALLKMSAKFLCCKCNKKETGEKALSFDCSSCEFFNKGFVEEKFIAHILGYDFLLDSSDDEDIKTKLHNNGFYFYRTNDDDLNALFKRMQIENWLLEENGSQTIDQLCEEYFSRKHKSVLWKSLLEYRAIYRMLDEDSSQRNIEELLERYNKLIKLKKKNQKYIHLEGEDKEIFEELGFCDALIIYGKANTKEISGTEFLVKYEDRVEQLSKLLPGNMLKEESNLEPRFIYANVTGALTHQKIRELNDRLRKDN